MEEWPSRKRSLHVAFCDREYALLLLVFLFWLWPTVSSVEAFATSSSQVEMLQWREVGVWEWEIEMMSYFWLTSRSSETHKTVSIFVSVACVVFPCLWPVRHCSKSLFRETFRVCWTAMFWGLLLHFILLCCPTNVKALKANNLPMENKLTSYGLRSAFICSFALHR